MATMSSSAPLGSYRRRAALPKSSAGVRGVGASLRARALFSRASSAARFFASRSAFFRAFSASFAARVASAARSSARSSASDGGSGGCAVRYLRNRSKVFGPTPWMALACSRLRTRDGSFCSEPTIFDSVFDHCASKPLRSTEDFIS
jgi:hypothetical protein